MPCWAWMVVAFCGGVAGLLAAVKMVFSPSMDWLFGKGAPLGGRPDRDREGK